jgi:hypothetical protein
VELPVGQREQELVLVQHEVVLAEPVVLVVVRLVEQAVLPVRVVADFAPDLPLLDKSSKRVVRRV